MVSENISPVAAGIIEGLEEAVLEAEGNAPKEMKKSIVSSSRTFAGIKVRARWRMVCREKSTLHRLIQRRR